MPKFYLKSVLRGADGHIAKVLGCYHRCPNKAIVYLNKKKKDRYINPNIDENLIGKNID